MSTPAQIRDKAGAKLGKKALGQALSNKVSSDLDEAYNEVYARLKGENLVSWTSTGDIPDAFVNPVVDLVAYARVTDYGVAGERYARIATDASQAELRIRRSLQNAYFKDTKDAVYY